MEVREEALIFFASLGRISLSPFVSFHRPRPQQNLHFLPSFFLLYFLRPPTSCITKTEEEEPAQPGSTEEGTTD